MAETRSIRVFYGFDALPRFRHPVVTVGVCDGVHRGHQALIGRLVAEARAGGGESVVVTFEPHPRIALGRAEGLRILTPLAEKIALFERFGVDNVIVIPFDRAFSTLSGAEFIERHILGQVGAETLVVGYDHHFGHDRIGYDALAAFGGLRIVRVDESRVDGDHVSSTAIRRLLEAGRLEEAERLLGYPLPAETPAVVVNPERTDVLRAGLLELWRRSVAATHHFLTDDDLARLSPAVSEGLRHVDTLCVAYMREKPVAFMGLDANKVEMLFVAPAHFGKGIGRELMRLAIDRLGARYVDVNEQNPAALGFYRQMGFEVFERTDRDGQGNPFPILRMKLK